MKIFVLVGSVIALAGGAGVAQLSSQGDRAHQRSEHMLVSGGDAHAPQQINDPQFPRQGPDIIVGRLYDLRRWGRVGDITAFSFGTESCNAGDTPVKWIANTAEHPVISQHMYRLLDGRFEMIGHSWLKHGFSAQNGDYCTGMFGYPCSETSSNSLGVGCSDAYTGGQNASYSWLGPKHEVNPVTGTFPYPAGSYPNSDPIGKRLQVRDQDLSTAQNPGALYFLEGHYVAAGDAAAGNGLNNASYRRVNVIEGPSKVFSLSWINGHDTQIERPAIYAWHDFDSDVQINTVDVPGDGRFFLGYKVTDNGDGTWSYEFAVHNFNSDRAGRLFSIPVSDLVSVRNIGFRSVPWHSGAPYADVPWTVVHEGGRLTWQTDTFDDDPDANALRWGTLYNFRFVANAPPEETMVELGLFKPGWPDSVDIPGVGPEAPVTGDLNGDGSVDVFDLLILLATWGPCINELCPADLNGSGAVDTVDMLMLLSSWY